MPVVLLPILLFILMITGCQSTAMFDLSCKLAPRVVSQSENEVKILKQYQQSYSNSVDFYDNFYQQRKEVPDIGKIKGAIVPHHLVAGYMPATLFSYLSKQKPSVVVLIGPNHFEHGRSAVISTSMDWDTPYGLVKTDEEIVKKLSEARVSSIEDSAIAGEHSLSAIIPFISKSLPQTKVVPIMLYYKTSLLKLDALLNELVPLLPDDAVFISSIDFSHYQTSAVSSFHDELARGVIKNFDYERLKKLEIDSTSSLYLLLKAMEYYGYKKIGFELSDNAANIYHDPALASGTSYYSPYFVTCHSEQDQESCNQKEKIASILNFGDMMLDRNVRQVIDDHDQDYILEKLAGAENRFFSGMDIISANLEGPFANSRRSTSKSIAFRFNPDLLPMLKKYNFSIFSQANNHSYDMGAAGFEESKANLLAGGFSFYGAQYKIDDSSLLIKKIGDFNFGFIGINDTNASINVDKATELIRKARRDKAVDYIIINAHWGEEYKQISNERERKLAHAFIDAGADVIIGHHPHVVQEMEIYKNRPIFYSLGNFIFDQYFSVPTKQGLGIGLIFKEKKIAIYIFPLQGTKSQVSQMPYKQGQEYLNNWLKNGRIDVYKFDNFNLKISL